MTGGFLDNSIIRIIISVAVFLFLFPTVVSVLQFIAYPHFISAGINYLSNFLYSFDFIIPVNVLFQLFFYAVVMESSLISFKVMIIIWRFSTKSGN